MALFLSVMGGWALYRGLTAETSQLQREEAATREHRYRSGKTLFKPGGATRMDAHLSRGWLLGGGLVALVAAGWCVRLAFTV